MKKLTILFAIIFLLVSCRKEPFEVINPDQHYCYTYADQFETIWTGIDQGYMFWSRETIDWDSVHEALLPVFRSFDANGGATDDELTAAYQSMVHGLIDHHMYVQVKNLKTGHPVMADPSWDEVLNRDYYHGNYYNQQVALVSSMEGVTEYRSGYSELPCCFALFPGSNGKKIAYLRFQSFRVGDLVNMVNNNRIDKAATAPFRAFYGQNCLDGVNGGWAGSDEVEAVIIDVRGNGGGSLSDLRPLVCSLTPTRTDFGYSRTKEGLGRLDYSAWAPFSFDPMPHHLNGDKKVVVLIDVNSASCAEITAGLVQLFPQGTVIGERSWGATCPLIPSGHDMFYSGIFGNYGTLGYYVYTSNFDLVDINYQSLEGIGVTPDIECRFDLAALYNGHDNQLERALQFIRTGK